MRGAISDAEIATNSGAEFGCGIVGWVGMGKAKTDAVFALNSGAEFGAGMVVGRRFLTQKSQRILAQNSCGDHGRCGSTAEFASNSVAFFASKNRGWA